MVSFKNHIMKGKEKTESKEKKTTSESVMTQMLELSKRKDKVTMINILRALIEKVDNMQELINNVIREMETQRKDQKDVFEI